MSNPNFRTFAVILRILIGLMVCTEIFSQGQVYFANRRPAEYDNRVTIGNGTIGLAGPSFTAQLILFQNGIESKVGEPIKFRTGAGAGYIEPAMVTFPFPEGTKVSLAMGVYADGQLFGRSAMAEFTLGGQSITPPYTQFGGAGDKIDLPGLLPARAEYEGGIVYWKVARPICPAYELVRISPSFYELRQGATNACGENQPHAEYTFVLGQHDPGTVVFIRTNTFGSAALSIPNVKQTTLKLQKFEAGTASFSINGHTNANYLVQRTVDLLTWQDLATVRGLSEFTDSSNAPSGQSFYRVIVKEPAPRVLQ
jgi:hypothetical protein